MVLYVWSVYNVMHCISVLYCTVRMEMQQCNVWQCIVLYGAVMQCIVLYGAVPQCTVI